MKMGRMMKGMLVAVLHLAIVFSLFGKLMYDRATRPRVWVQTVPYDPNLPIRGRYLSMSLEVEARDMKQPETKGSGVYQYTNLYSRAYLKVEGDKLIAVRAPDDAYDSNAVNVSLMSVTDKEHVRINDPVLFFIPEHAQDPSRRPGQELWVEVTIPKKGPPRPIRLGIKKGGGEIQPFDVRNQ